MDYKEINTSTDRGKREDIKDKILTRKSSGCRKTK
jgi:hypothetical protein